MLFLKLSVDAVLPDFGEAKAGRTDRSKETPALAALMSISMGRLASRSAAA